MAIFIYRKNSIWYCNSLCKILTLDVFFFALLNVLCCCYLNHKVLQFAGGLLFIIILAAVFLLFMVRTRRMRNPIERLRSMSTNSKGGPFIENNFESVVTRPNNKSKAYNVRLLFWIAYLLSSYHNVDVCIDKFAKISRCELCLFPVNRE